MWEQTRKYKLPGKKGKCGNVVVQIWNIDKWGYKLVECGSLRNRGTFKSGMQMPKHVP